MTNDENIIHLLQLNTFLFLFFSCFKLFDNTCYQNKLKTKYEFLKID